MHKEASTITDIHNTSDRTEVNLISLVCDQIPKYRLRARSETGYDQQDWLQTPLLSQNPDADLSPELYEKTFEYFILSGDRLSQMTQTYHDIEAVTNLLEEKERDLELAARIGQTLLQKNREAELLNEQLEQQLEKALEEVSQLKHEISLKEHLLHTYADDENDSSAAPSPVKEFRRFNCNGMMGHLEGLQSSIRRLEVDNNKLRLDKMKYECESDELENQEQELVSDAFKELDDLRRELQNARRSNNFVAEELSQKTDEAVRLQEEITRLLTKIVEMQRKHKQLALENEELQHHLFAANNAQLELTREIQTMEDQYDEISNALGESREEARLLREHQGEDFMQQVPFRKSLAAELEFDESIGNNAGVESLTDWLSKPVENDSLKGATGENNDSVYSFFWNSTSRSPSQHTFDTVKFVKSLRKQLTDQPMQLRTLNKQARPIPTPFPLSQKGNLTSNSISSYVNTSGDSGCDSNVYHVQEGRDSRMAFLSVKKHAIITPKNLRHVKAHLHEKPSFSRLRLLHEAKNSLTNGCAIEDAEFEKPSLSSICSKFIGSSTPSLGRPGVPGTEDLEKAIKKLALRRESLRYLEVERRRYQSNLRNKTFMKSGLPTLNLSQSVMSSSSDLTENADESTSQIPKLRIVKPLEGSITLNQWKYLAAKDRTLQLPKDLSAGVLTRDQITKTRNEPKKKGRESLTSFDSVKPFRLTSTPIQSGHYGLDKVLKNTESVNNLSSYVETVTTIGNLTAFTMCHGNGFAFTPPKYTFTNCRVKCPDDGYEVTPSSTRSHPKMSSTHSKSSSASCDDKTFPSSSFNSSSGTKISTSRDNTRTCSTELGIAQLLKEHGAKNTEKLTKPSAIEKEKEEEATNVGHKETNASLPAALMKGTAGSFVWNRTLGRAFLLSAHNMSQLFASNSARYSEAMKPETPPNSPTLDFEDRFSFPNDEHFQQPNGNQSRNTAEQAGPSHRQTHVAEDLVGDDAKSSEACAAVVVSSSNHPSCNDPQNTDWSELHGSSGSLCINEDKTETTNGL